MPNEIDALLARVDDPALRNDLKTQVDRLRQKRQFGLVFEEHLPELVTLPHHPVRRGTKVVRRDDDGAEPRAVVAVNSGLATLPTDDGGTEDVPTESLVAVAEFGEPIYPGLKRLGSVDRGGDKPAHVVIKGENHHALEALQFTHAGKVDCIYIDPPYNSGARDWKYNNDYVDGDDDYRHSKWLAMMKRRLLVAKELLNPEGSALIVTIDEKEVHRLGVLLDQLFPGVRPRPALPLESGSRPTSSPTRTTRPVRRTRPNPTSAPSPREQQSARRRSGRPGLLRRRAGQLGRRVGVGRSGRRRGRGTHRRLRSLPESPDPLLRRGRC